MEIGIKLKKARKEKGITQEQAAEALGVSRQTVSNWENNKSYPDIISVIKMSDLYSVSLDHLLKDKEEKAMNQTYQEFLEESTNTVKAKRKLGTIILTAAYFLVWIASMILFWRVREPAISEFTVILRWILLPSFLLVTTVTVSGNDYWGKGNWLCVLGAAVMFLTVPDTHFTEEAGMIKYTFRFPNFTYMAAGIFVALCGIGIGTVWRRRVKEERGL